ncbi:MAG TPA: P-loop NTPase fold protein [Savagea sp.]
MKESIKRIQWEKFKREYLPLEGNEGKEAYLFKKQLEKLERILSNIDHEENDDFNKVIGISGERGSGKSSLLWTFKNVISEEKEGKKYYALEPIDPNYLDKNMGLLEIILTTLYNEVDKHVKTKKDCDLQQAKRVKRSILRQIELQTNMRQGKGFSNQATPTELIEEYKSRVSFQEEYDELFKSCWSLLVGSSCENYKRGYLVILIDDIDIVNNDLIYDMLEDIKMVLSQNTTTVLTYRKTQLESSLYNVKIEENRELIDHFSLVDREEVIRQGDTYLEKLIAQNNTVEMETYKGILERPLKDLFTDLDDREYLGQRGMDVQRSVRTNIYQFIESNILINIESRDYRELERFESSFNLRGIIQLFEMLVEGFKDLDGIKKSEEFTENIRINTTLVKNYILGKGTDLLSKEDLSLLYSWDRAAAKNKNYILYAYIYKKMCKRVEANGCENLSATEVYNELLDIKSVQYYNICLGDIVQVLSYEKMFNEDNIFHFYVKVMYSIELLLSLVEEVYEVNSNEIKLRYEFISQPVKKEELKDRTMIEGSDKNIINNYKFNSFFKSSNDHSEVNVFYNTTYYQLTRYKILPFNKYVFPGVTSARFYFSRTNCPQLLDKVTYTVLSPEGEQLPGSRKINGKKTPKIGDYQYRAVFMPSFSPHTKKYLAEADIEEENYQTVLTNRSNFNVDPFTVLVKEWYLAEVAAGRQHYLFYSIFDIDTLMRVNLNPKKSDHQFIARHILKKVNNAVQSFSVLKNLNALGTIHLRDDYKYLKEYFENKPVIAVYTDEEIECSNHLVGSASWIKENIDDVTHGEMKDILSKDRVNREGYAKIHFYLVEYKDELEEKEVEWLEQIEVLSEENDRKKSKALARRINKKHS